ncbi:MAG: RHS repeat protein, partial [Haliea sp.]
MTAFGNPISSSSGNKYQREQDYVSPAGLSFARHYNSSLPGWTHDFSARVLENTLYATILRPDGRGIVHVGAGTGTWSASPYETGELTRLTQASSTDPLWQYVTADDQVELFDAAGRLLKITARGGQSLVAARNGSGLLTSITNDFGRALTFQYQSGGRLGTVTTPEGTHIAYGYDGQGRLAQVTYPDSSTRQYLYENIDYPLALTGLIDERANRYSTWSYDALGRAITSVYVGGVDAHTLTFNIDGSTSITDPLLTTRTQQFADLGDMVTYVGQTQPCANCSGEAASKVLNALGFPEEETDYLGVKTMYTWDITRKLSTGTTQAQGHPEARSSTTTWHPSLRVPALVAEPGRTTAYTYDALGNKLTEAVTDTVTGQSRTWTWTYTAQKLPATLTDPKGGLWQYGYDSLGNRATVTNPLGQVTTFTHDAAGRVLTQTDPNGLVTTNTYDLRGRLTSQVRGSETTSFSYIPTGQIGTVTQPSGYRIVYSYDAAQRLTGAQDNHGAQIIYTL